MTAAPSYPGSSDSNDAARAIPRNRAGWTAFVLALCAIVIHVPYLKLPFHWDELGQFIPAALDLYQHGYWIPHRTLPNVHPPAVMAALALIWQVFGFSILSARLAMLAIAALGVALCYLLAIRLTKGARAAAMAATLFLIASPIFYTQSTMALLDMPAMTFTLLALLLFLERRYTLCAAACVILVLTKETAITAPMIFGAWLLFKERQPRQALYFFAPAAALGLWLSALHGATGHWLGNPEFAQYNAGSVFEVHHLSFAFLGRAWFLLAAQGHIIGAVALALGWRRLRGSDWTIASLTAGAQLILVTVFGGAELERYLLPVLPVLYIAMAAAACAFSVAWRWASYAAMLSCFIVGWFWQTPFPWPYEDNLDVVDFVRLQQTAAHYLEEQMPSARIATAWPLSDELQYPEMGYVNRPLKALKAPGLHPEEIAGLGRANFDVLVMFTNKRPVQGSSLDLPLLRSFLRYYYDYQPQASPEEIREAIGFVPSKRWERRGQWIEIYLPLPEHQE
jgi:hypothetical protein